MVVNKPKKNRAMRGSRTYGWGSPKKHRGKGSRGGVGKSGMGKRGQHKMSLLNSLGIKNLGSHGFVRPRQEAFTERAINLFSIEANAEKWLGKKIAVEEKGIIIVDLEKDRIAKRIPFKGWHTKGISVTDKYIVIGLSEVTFRDKRFVAQGKLAVLDRKSLSILKIVDLNFQDLPHPIGNVNEIRCLSEVDLAQSRPTETRINWGDLKFAKQNILSHSLNRVRICTLLPLRRFKGYIRTRI